MPSTSTLTEAEKTRIKTAVPKPGNRILGAAFSRIYYAAPHPDQWSYTGLQGAVVFSYDEQKAAFFLKMVDLDGTRGVIWEHELYDGFEYFQDRGWFHSFEGDVSRVSCSAERHGSAELWADPPFISVTRNA